MIETLPVTEDKMSVSVSAECLTLPALPSEVLVHIFRFLPHSDVLECCLVSKTWWQAGRAMVLHRNTLVALVGDDEFSSGFPVFSDLDPVSSSALSAFSLVDASLNVQGRSAQWASLLPALTSLELRRCVLSEKDLVAVLSQCSNLQRLALIDMNQVFISGRFLSSPEDAAPVREALKGVRELDLSSNQYMSDALFNQVTSCTGALTALVLNHCRIMNHSGIYKKYYPNTQETPSPAVFTFRNLLTFLSERAGSLKRLGLHATSVDGFAVQDMVKLEGLSLLSLDLGRCSMVSQESILDLARSQKNLRELNLDYCRRVFMDYPATSLSILQEREKSIKLLSLKGLSIPSIFESCLATTENLQELNCSEIDCPGIYLTSGLAASKSRFSLRKFNLHSFGCSPENMSGLVSLLPNIRVLDLGNCQEGVTDSVLQAIIANMKQLEDLTLGNCRRLTDAGFSGLMPESQSDLEKDGAKIFLGSKAEAEVLSDAQRRAKLKELYETKQDAKAELKIDSLNRLLSLDVSFTNVTDLSLVVAFNFKQLRHLNISQCKEITNVGLNALSSGNFMLESLTAKQCSIGDSALQGLARNTPRLKLLDIEGCKAVTSEAVCLVVNRCSGLRQLDVSFCTRVSAHMVETLATVRPSLRAAYRGLHIHECLGDYEDDNVIIVPPAPPSPVRPK